MKITVEPSASHVRRANRDKTMVVRCRQGQYDTYPKPELPESNTPDQVASRQAWSRSCTAWTGLSAEEKAGWNAYAAANETAFSRRTPEPLTGYRLFKSAAGNRQILGLDMPTDAPVQRPPDALPRVELLPSAEANTLRLRVRHKLAGEAFRVVVSMSPATLRSSRKPDRRNGRHVRGWGAASTAPLPPSGGEITFTDCRYAIEPGQRFGVWIRVVRISDGLGSPEQFLDFTRDAQEEPVELSGSGEREEPMVWVGSDSPVENPEKCTVVAEKSAPTAKALASARMNEQLGDKWLPDRQSAAQRNQGASPPWDRRHPGGKNPGPGKGRGYEANGAAGAQCRQDGGGPGGRCPSR